MKDIKPIPDSLLPNKAILVALRGSYSTGTQRPGISDVDLLATHFGPLEHYLGFRRKGQETFRKQEGEWDVVSYDIRKMFRLLLGGNPNVVSILFVPDDMVLKRTYLGEAIRENREIFLSTEFYKSFKGYAISMRERLEKQKFEGYKGNIREDETEELGYNPKAASEMIRIVNCGIELMKEGTITYPRPNAEFLKAIKNGEYNLDALIEIHRQKISKLKFWLNHTNLPEEPDRDRAEELLMRLIRMEYNL